MSRDSDALDMRWENAETIAALPKDQSDRREGIDDFLAEGAKRVSENLGGDAAKMGAHVLN